ncbi:MAG: glycosyltransferase family 2 protein [Candidatus Roizmanbacteria bacterium]|nr:glycosyltransferase family 2 protein [Candidatus Roizmanbacteria bacterium]
MSHTLAILTVVYQNYTTLKDFFDSLSKQTSKDFHVYIFDGSPEKEPIDLPPYAERIQGDNKGYANGIKTAYSAAKKKHDYFAVVNSDIIFDTHFVGNVIQSLAKNQKSLVGGKIYYAPGYEYHETRYEPKDLGHVFWYAGGYIDWNNVLAIHRGVDCVDVDQFSTKENTGFITGCLMCYTKQTASILGTWDTKYIMYFEDADYCIRAKQKNIPLIYDPSIIIWHKNAQSSGGSGSRIQEKFMNRSRLLFGLRYAPLRTKVHLLKNEALRYLRLS